MKEGPDIARIGALVGDPARANILTALMGGQALTASELAASAGVTAQTASSHLARLVDADLLSLRKQGRHKYFTLSGDDVGQMLEAMMGLAAAKGHTRLRVGPRDPALRHARVCYDHLAGQMGVRMFDALCSNDLLAVDKSGIALTDRGRVFAHEFGIDTNALSTQRRPVCRACLDWSMRRDHLAGALGAAIYDRILEKGWAKRLPGSRVIAFSKTGQRAFDQTFMLQGA